MRIPATALVILLAATTASGHGTPPMTTDVRFTTSDPKTILVGSTIGLLLTRDGGCTVEWICESNVGYGPTYQPKYAFAADGSILATTFLGLRISRDGGCNFTTATAALPVTDPNRIADMWIDALDVGPMGEIWVGTSENGRSNDIFVSIDNGETFTPRGLMSTTVAYKSVKVAPSDATRVYVTGAAATTAQLYRSDATGWITLPATGIAVGAVPRLEIAVVDPNDRDTLYVISRAVAAPRDDRLYRSSDGGMTFVEVLVPSAKIHDVTVRDAQTVYVTTMVLHVTGNFDLGGPTFVSTDGGKLFGLLDGAPQLACLSIAPDGTPVGCGWNWEPDFKAIASLDGNVWNKLWRFVEIAGPIACPADSGNSACDREWTQLEIDLGVTGPTCGPHASSDAGIDIPPPPPPPGCCSVNGGGSLGLVWAVAIAWRLRRRRRRR